MVKNYGKAKTRREFDIAFGGYITEQVENEKITIKILENILKRENKKLLLLANRLKEQQEQVNITSAIMAGKTHSKSRTRLN